MPGDKGWEGMKGSKGSKVHLGLCMQFMLHNILKTISSTNKLYWSTTIVHVRSHYALQGINGTKGMAGEIGDNGDVGDKGDAGKPV